MASALQAVLVLAVAAASCVAPHNSDTGGGVTPSDGTAGAGGGVPITADAAAGTDAVVVVPDAAQADGPVAPADAPPQPSRPPGMAGGSTCRAGGDCLSGYCVDGHCCIEASCRDCQRCTGEGGTCQYPTLVRTESVPDGLSVLLGFASADKSVVAQGQSFRLPSAAGLRRVSLVVSSFTDDTQATYKGSLAMVLTLRDANGGAIRTSETVVQGTDSGTVTWSLEADLAASTTYILTTYAREVSARRTAATIKIAYGGGGLGIDYPGGQQYTAYVAAGHESELDAWSPPWSPQPTGDLVIDLEGCPL